MSCHFLPPDFHLLLQTGVLVCRVYSLSKAKGIIQKDDIITKIDGKSVANDGTIEFRNSNSVGRNYYSRLTFIIRGKDNV